MCRAGFPGHLEAPWSNFDAVEIDFVIQMKHLTDAGYDVLAYDIRNHGNSGAANGGLSGIGRWEWRDCVGVKKYVDSHPALGKMKVGLYSQCMGGNSQYEAIYRRPELFANVLCMCSPMVVSMAAIFNAFSEIQGIRQYQELIDLELLKMGAFVAAEMTPHLWASGVRMPVLMIRVLRDSRTRNPEDAQKTFDLLGSEEKELFWIEGTTRALQGRLQLLRKASEKNHRLLRQAHEMNDLVRLRSWSMTFDRAVALGDLKEPRLTTALQRTPLRAADDAGRWVDRTASRCGSGRCINQ